MWYDILENKKFDVKKLTENIESIYYCHKFDPFKRLAWKGLGTPLENVNDSESSEFSIFKPEILEAIDTIRTKKERTDVNSIYKELFRNQASNIDEKQ